MSCVFSVFGVPLKHKTLFSCHADNQSGRDQPSQQTINNAEMRQEFPPK